MLTVVVNTPDKFSELERACFCALVVTEGQVSRATLPTNIVAAHALAFAVDEGVLVGVAALKNPQPAHRASVQRKAGVKLDATLHPYELGYVVVSPSHRGKGVSRRLCEGVLAHAGELAAFATSTTDNEAMHRTLQRYGFQRVGDSYDSTEHPEKQVAVFVQPAPK